MNHISLLQERFCKGNPVSFVQLNNGIVLMKIDNAHATATISLYGGHVVAWQPKSQRVPVLWCSDLVQYKPGKAIRAGIPICWPWFGAHPTDSKSPSHGYARISSWELSSVKTTASGSTEVCMTMLHSDYTRSEIGVAANLFVTISIGQELSMDLKTTNVGDEPIHISEALHAYFCVGDIAEINIYGLNDCQYVDLVDGNVLKTQSGAIQFTEELGRVYLDTHNDCQIEDPVLNRKVRISKTGSQSTVVWNPWLDTASKMDDLGSVGWRSMVCVESANALQNTVAIQPGKEHVLHVNYSVS